METTTPTGEIVLASQTGGAGTLALAQMPEAEFEQRLATLKTGASRIARVKRELMTDGVHYGVIPGTDKPALYKAGAEILCQLYSLRPDFIPDLKYGDGETSPAVRAVVRCELHLGDIMGPVVAVGMGTASTWEKKYRYRRGERSCPACGKVGSVIKGKAEYGGGWICFAKKNGCGAKYADKAPEIVDQVVGDIANPDQDDLENTVVKMACKRAQLDATLRGTASSDLFTQDLDDVVDVTEAQWAQKIAGAKNATELAAVSVALKAAYPPMPVPLRDAYKARHAELVPAGADPGADQPSPAAMPQRKAAPSSPTTTPTHAARPFADPPASPNVDGSTGPQEDTVVDVQDPTKPKAPYRIHFKRAGWLSTFSDSLADVARNALELGVPVRLTTEKKGDFVNVKTLEAAEPVD